MKKYFFLTTILLVAFFVSAGQSYDLQKLHKEKKLDTFGATVTPISEKQGVSSDGIAWLKGVTFSTGSIDIDLRGKDVLQKSFIGIAFHGIDTGTYDAIYFRPFNFNSPDPVRKIHAVQYISQPVHTWHKLREEKNGIYEKAVTPAPAASDWFHARIVIESTTISVYVNNSSTPSLVVEKLNDRKSGLIGIWTDSGPSLPGDFANLVIKK